MNSISRPIRVLVAGLGNMGMSHAIAYHDDPKFEIVGLVNRTELKLPTGFDSYPLYNDFKVALRDTKPEMCSINTYSDSHANYSVMALEAGCHVFVEKPLATTAEDAERVVAAAKRANRKLLVGYILRQHPLWTQFITAARAFGPPYIFRMNLNQQSCGAKWNVHKHLMHTTSPVTDSGVHYVDVWCQITDAKPIEVRAMGLRITDEVDPSMYNYGHMQVLFADGSLGWFEAGWGPMISEAAFFVKDVMSPNGSVSIVVENEKYVQGLQMENTMTMIRIHSAEIGHDGCFAHPDHEIPFTEILDRRKLCGLQATYMLKAICEDLDLTRRMDDAVQSLRICLAADESVRSGKPVYL